MANIDITDTSMFNVTQSSLQLQPPGDATSNTVLVILMVFMGVVIVFSTLIWWVERHTGDKDAPETLSSLKVTDADIMAFWERLTRHLAVSIYENISKPHRVEGISHDGFKLLLVATPSLHDVIARYRDVSFVRATRMMEEFSLNLCLRAWNSSDNCADVSPNKPNISFPYGQFSQEKWQKFLTTWFYTGNMPNILVLSALVDPDLRDLLSKVMETLKWTLVDLSRVAVRRHLRGNVFRSVEKLGLPEIIRDRLVFGMKPLDDDFIPSDIDYEVLEPNDQRASRGWRLRIERQRRQQGVGGDNRSPIVQAAWS